MKYAKEGTFNKCTLMEVLNALANVPGDYAVGACHMDSYYPIMGISMDNIPDRVSFASVETYGEHPDGALTVEKLEKGILGLLSEQLELASMAACLESASNTDPEMDMQLTEPREISGWGISETCHDFYLISGDEIGYGPDREGSGEDGRSRQDTFSADDVVHALRELYRDGRKEYMWEHALAFASELTGLSEERLTGLMAKQKQKKMRTVRIVLSMPYQIGESAYTQVYRTVEAEIPDDGRDWRVAGEAYPGPGGRRDAQGKPIKKIGVILQAHPDAGKPGDMPSFCMLEAEIPDDGHDWHVAGEGTGQSFEAASPMGCAKEIPWLPEPGIEPEKISRVITDLISEIYKYGKPIWATQDFLMLLDCVNELSRAGTRPSKQLQEKYLPILCSLAKDLQEDVRW